MMEWNKIYNEDCLQGMKKLPDDCIDCCVTSPPYWALRDYGHKDQIGLETTPEEYVNNIVAIFREVKRVLKPEGTLWLNLGDSYATSGKSRTKEQAVRKSTLKGSLTTQCQSLNQPSKIVGGLKPKDLVGIPWMVAFALRADGWYLRQDIIWNKPNPMPESVTDRCTKSHEYIFLLSKSPKYFFDQDAIRVPVKDQTVRRLIQNIEQQTDSDRVPGKTNGKMKAVYPGRKPRKGVDINGGNQASDKGIPLVSMKQKEDGSLLHSSKANKKSVWTVTTKPFKEAHFATFPQDLIVNCIKAGTPENGSVLDPFMGAGTTALVSRKLGRNYIGFEVNSEYIEIAQKRLKNELGMFI